MKQERERSFGPRISRVGYDNDRPPAFEANIDECPALFALRFGRAFDIIHTYMFRIHVRDFTRTREKLGEREKSVSAVKDHNL